MTLYIIDMSNISILKELEDHEGYKELSNRECALTLCVNCQELNILEVNQKMFNCVKCGIGQTA